jgi:hypothetical protein
MVRGTLPLVVNGEIIEDFSITFQQGRVVSATAKLDIDEGSPRPGEVAMVPQSSPIASEGRLFYNTLFDENASCHLALGRAYHFFLAKWRPAFHCGIHRCWRESEPSSRGFHDMFERTRYRRADFGRERRSDYEGRQIAGNSLYFS